MHHKIKHYFRYIFNMFFNNYNHIYKDDENPDEDGIKRSLMDAEKLKLQIINNYVK